jgi:cell division protein FtsZ
VESAQPFLLGALAVALVVGALALVWVIAARRRRRRALWRRALRIVVMGIGGAGGNAVDRMISVGTSGVEFMACNTDAQVLRRSRASRKIQVGDKLTGGLGAGGDPAIGQRAAEEDADRIARAVAGADMVFITAGLGGGTGSGAGPVVAAIAREAGALTVGVVTLPFAFEGAKRREVADRAAEELLAKVDTLIVIPNDGVRNVVLGDVSMLEAFRVVDDILRQGIEGVIDLIAQPGFINLDFADVRSVLKDSGSGLIGVGRASGERRATQAAHDAIRNALMGGGITGARGVLLNVAGSRELTLAEVTEVAEVVRAAADRDANVIFGATFDDSLGDTLEVTLIATGFVPASPDEARPIPASAEPIIQYVPPEYVPREYVPPESFLPERSVDPPMEPVSREPVAVSVGPAPEETIRYAPSRRSGPSPDELDIPSFVRRPPPPRSSLRPNDPSD